MCLMIELSISKPRRDKAVDLIKELQRAAALELRAQRRPKAATSLRFFLSERGQGCACSLLSAGADWDLPIHRLGPEKCAALERTLHVVAQYAGASGFALEAAWLDGTWDGRPKPRRIRVRLDELLEDIRQATIRSGVLYEIVGDARTR